MRSENRPKIGCADSGLTCNGPSADRPHPSCRICSGPRPSTCPAAAAMICLHHLLITTMSGRLCHRSAIRSDFQARLEPVSPVRMNNGRAHFASICIVTVLVWTACW